MSNNNSPLDLTGTFKLHPRLLDQCKKLEPTCFSGQPRFSNQKKKSEFAEPISLTRFLEPDFLNQISKNCKNRGHRIKGLVDALLPEVEKKTFGFLMNLTVELHYSLSFMMWAHLESGKL